MTSRTPRLDLAWRSSTRHPAARATGAIADLADRLGLPAWPIRIGAVMLFLDWPWVTGGAYLALSLGLRTGLASLLPPPVVRAVRARRAARPAPDPGPLRDQFARLEARLARLEDAVTSDEMKLRRGFRDLGG